MKTYSGKRIDGDYTYVNVKEEDGSFIHSSELIPGPSLRVRNHSPSGFDWGYRGSAATQLALAILLNCFTDNNRTREAAEALAVRHYVDFLHTYVVGWKEEWSITETEICAFIEDNEEIGHEVGSTEVSSEKRG